MLSRPLEDPSDAPQLPYLSYGAHSDLGPNGQGGFSANLADLHDEWQTTDDRNLSEGLMSLLYPRRDGRHNRADSRLLTPKLNPRVHHSTGALTRDGLAVHPHVVRLIIQGWSDSYTQRTGSLAGPRTT